MPGGIPGATGTPATGCATHPTNWLTKIAPIVRKLHDFFIVLSLIGMMMLVPDTRLRSQDMEVVIPCGFRQQFFSMFEWHQ